METVKELPTLENIPPELRLRILSSIPDVQTLRSLVRASPTYHEQHRLDRDRILQNCLELEMDGFYVDAHATLRSRVRNLGRARSNKTITDFLSSYRRWISRPTSAPAISSNSPGEVRWLSAFHLSVVLPLAGQICQWALGSLRKAATPSADEAVDKLHTHASTVADVSLLSTSERIRVLRALYRCETYHRLFRQHHGRRFGELDDNVITELFFNAIHPWEAEEVGCINDFVRERYDEIFIDVKADLRPDNPRFDDDRVPGCDPKGSFMLDFLWYGTFDAELDMRNYEHFAHKSIIFRVVAEYMDGTISRGLKTIAGLLTDWDHDQLVAKVALFATGKDHKDAPLGQSLSIVAQWNRRDDDYTPNAKDEAQGRLDAMVFVGDTVPPSTPASAWVQLW